MRSKKSFWSFLQPSSKKVIPSFASGDPDETDLQEAKDNVPSVFEEVTYLDTDKVIIENDIYNMTIAANMTKNVTVTQINYSLKICVQTFLIQMILIYYYGYDFYTFNNF